MADNHRRPPDPDGDPVGFLRSLPRIEILAEAHDLARYLRLSSSPIKRALAFTLAGAIEGDQVGSWAAEIGLSARGGASDAQLLANRRRDALLRRVAAAIGHDASAHALGLEVRAAFDRYARSGFLKDREAGRLPASEPGLSLYRLALGQAEGDFSMPSSGQISKIITRGQ